MPPIHTQKRSACDRCRLQKLRCPPSTDGREPCQRCTRLGAQCITSYPRPPNGAPQTNPPPPPPPQPELRPKTINALPSPAATVTAANVTSRPIDITSAPSSISPAHRSDSLASSVNMLYDPVPFSLDESFDYFAGTTTFQLDNMDVMSDYSGSLLFTNDNGGFPSPTPSPNNGGSNSADVIETAEPMYNMGGENPSNAQQNNIFQSSTRLSSLNFDLSKRLDQCLGSNSENSLMLYEHGMETGSRNDSVTSNPGVNGVFENALGDLSEFLAIIQSYAAKRNIPSARPATRDHSSQGASGTGSIPNQRISLVVFMNLISAYLQIIGIYEKIFRTLSMSLSGGLVDFNSGRNTDLRVTGLSLGQGTLHTKLLVHAVLHQFDVIERMLGLPVELRVTEKEGVYRGLFEDDRARGLLGAVSNESRVENGWGSGQLNTDDRSSLSVLSSLRESLRMVLAVLEA